MRRILRRFTTSEINYYSVLEVPNTASLAKIRAQFLRLTKIYHPDIYKGKDTNRYTTILQAYEVLKNPQKRRDYDAKLRQSSRGRSDEGFASTDTQNDSVPPEETPNKFGLNDQKFDKDVFVKEFEEFKKRKITTKFDKVRFMENQLERNLSDHEKNRMQFVEQFNKVSKSAPEIDEAIPYEQIFRATINEKNEQASKKSETRSRFAWLKTVMQYQVTLGIFLTFLAMGLFGFTRELLHKRNENIDFQNAQYEMKRQYINELEDSVARSRFVYEQSKPENS